jgi:uncharacterized protein (TIGR02757 family)
LYLKQTTRGESVAQPAVDNSLKTYLDELYERLNKRKYVQPDPLALLYAYHKKEDLEMVGMLASSLAFGRVTQIVANVARVLQLLPDPASSVKVKTRGELGRLLEGFKHRWATGDEVADLLFGVGELQKRYGSLEDCFMAHYRDEHETVIPALGGMIGELETVTGNSTSCLLPDPLGSSACKRHHLFLRWMVRKDDVDLGVWSKVPASKLVVPLDVHMHRIAASFGFTERKQADHKAALEITDHFKEILPEDPVRYDFALTRLGIRDDMNTDELPEGCRQDPD